MQEGQYSVKTHVFEGPLETLLTLIEKRKLFINDISLANVADDYIAYVKSLEDFPLADSAQFILIASILVLIKSKSLLPNLSLTEEEEKNIDDLEKRLEEYQKYKNLSKHLKDKFGMNIEYFKLQTKNDIIIFSPDKNISISKIKEVIESIIKDMPKKEFVPKAIVQKVISLEEMITDLTDRITSSMKMSFKEFAGSFKNGKGKEEKINMIVGFLAMLELVKQGIIQVRQDRNFQDIEMESEVIGVPRY